MYVYKFYLIFFYAKFSQCSTNVMIFLYIGGIIYKIIDLSTYMTIKKLIKIYM